MRLATITANKDKITYYRVKRHYRKIKGKKKLVHAHIVRKKIKEVNGLEVKKE